MRKQGAIRAGISYAWVILAVLFVGLLATFGMSASFGAYITPWEHDFSVGRTVVTSISMLNFIVFAFGQPLAGKLNDHFGKNFVPSVSIFLVGFSLLLTSRANHIWQIFLLYGVVFPLGISGCCNIIAASIITRWFVEKRGLALGLTTSGMAVGQLVLVPANLFIIEQAGWRRSMATLSIIIMVVVGLLYIFLLRSKPEEKGMKPYGYTEPDKDAAQNGNAAPEVVKTLPIISVFKQKAFLLLSITSIICGFTDVGLIQTHLIPMAEGKGFPVSIAALAFSLIAISNIAGTIITGHLSDHISRKWQLAVIWSVRALTYIFLIFLNQPWMLPIFAVIYGLSEMATIAPINSLTVQLFDKYSIGMMLGIVAVSHQIGGAIGSWVPGLLFDMTGSYTAVLTLSIVLLFGAALLSLGIPEIKNSVKIQTNNK